MISIFTGFLGNHDHAHSHYILDYILDDILYYIYVVGRIRNIEEQIPSVNHHG